MIVGLTGGIATGKSTVSQRLQQLGYVVIDSDQIARQVVEPGQSALEQIVAHFGQGILLPDGRLDRAALGKIVFNDPIERKVLEAITHPAIFVEKERQIKEALSHGHEIIFLDVPLLIETNLYKTVDKVLLVYTSEQIQLHRLMERDRLSMHEAMKRIRAQMPIDEKRPYADFIIDNSGSKEQLEAQVHEVLSMLRKGAV